MSVFVGPRLSVKCVQKFVGPRLSVNTSRGVGVCGLADQCWVHKQKVVGLSLLR